MTEIIRTSSPYRRTSVTIDQVRSNIAKLSNGRTVSVAQLTGYSPEPIPDTPLEQFQLFVYGNYGAEDCVNVMRQAKPGSNGKMSPVGKGLTLLRDKWVRNIQPSDLDNNDGGVWIRYNPVTPTGSGKAGAYTDRDITKYHFVLLESDSLELDEQATLLAHLDLPIVSIVSTGKRSLHALVKVCVGDATEYKRLVSAFFRYTAHFGADCSNANPSRMTRAPGGYRPDGSGGGALQQLLYFNPKVKLGPIINNIK